MPLLSSFEQVVLFVLFFIPGIVFGTVRIALVGHRGPDTAVGTRVLEALFISLMFHAVYAVLLGSQLAQLAQTLEGVSLIDAAVRLSLPTALLVLVFLVVVPALVSAGIYLKPRVVEGKRSTGGIPKLSRAGSPKKRLAFGNTYRATPQAWDFRANNLRGPGWVRVRSGSTYYGGWFGHSSYMSTYPHPRDIFIERQWKLDVNGAFLGEIVGTAGVWLSVNDTSVVEWLDGKEQA